MMDLGITPRHRRLAINERRKQLRAAGRCINGSLVPGKPGQRGGVVHGPANPKSGKCDRCEEVARRGR